MAAGIRRFLVISSWPLVLKTSPSAQSRRRHSRHYTHFLLIRRLKFVARGEDSAESPKPEPAARPFCTYHSRRRAKKIAAWKSKYAARALKT